VSLIFQCISPTATRLRWSILLYFVFHPPHLQPPPFFTPPALTLSSTLSTDVTGYVATDPKNKLVVVAFRGSASIDNWITDLDYKAASVDLCSGCTAHRGFWQSWLDSRTDILAALKTLAKSHPDYKVVATGHSLGGAIASFAAAQLRNDGYDVALYTFGAPRIAGPRLSDYITNQQGGNYRVTHWNDPVPRLPPIAFGFVHISKQCSCTNRT
jgi:predicted lipase